jgi:hypothetical protein
MTINWFVFVANLPGRNQTLRMRVWRSLKSSGAGALRDGVYVLPVSDGARAVFERQSQEIRDGGGTAYILEVAATTAGGKRDAFLPLFDRSAEYQACAAKLRTLRRDLGNFEEVDARRRLAALSREVSALAAIDFFPGEPRMQVEGALADLATVLNARYSLEEPHPAKRKLVRLDPKKYRGRIWATRERLWIDRVCSAWLIRRFIDPRAKFLWLKRTKDCPRRAVGFDFDGAEFTHVDARVTFEVLLASFGLDGDPALTQLGGLVHFLDVGGISVPEAPGLAAIVSGARAGEPNDDGLLRLVSPVLDSLYRAYASLES